MSNQHPDKPIANHNYDGIQELDNPLPRWWLYGFYLTIVFAVIYSVYYFVGPGKSLAEIYQDRVLALQSQKPVDAGGFNIALLATIRTDSALRSATEAMYAEKCAACHGDRAQGVIGPNLTDAYWIHGGKPDQVLKTIRTGVGDKGMPAWGELIKPEDTAHLAAFVLSLRDTNPPGAKEPQGKIEKE